MAKSITWDGEDLSAYSLQVNSFSIPELSNTPAVVHNALYGDSQVSNSNHLNRSIVLVCSVTGSTEANLQSNMDAVKMRLNPLLTEKVFSLDDDEPSRRFVGRVTSVSEATVYGRWGKVFSVGIEAMAHRQDYSETNVSASIATNPDTLTVSSPTGTVSRMPAEFYVRNETGAALTSTAITVANDTTTETITWTGTLGDDQWLKIGSLDSLGRFRATIELSDGTGADPEAETYSDSLSGYTSGDWPRLKPGSDNSITVTGVSTGTLETTYRGRYL